MSRAAARVRCYNCGRLGPRDAADCGRCGATFGALCECGADHSVFDDECPKCAAPHSPNRCPTAKLPQVRAAKWTALCLAVSATTWIVWNKVFPSNQPAWRLKAQAVDAFNAADYDTSARICREVTETAAPNDPEGWYLLAESYRALKFPVESYKSAAETAVKYQDDFFLARELLAKAELELGHLDRAIEHAVKATRAPNATANAWMLLARLELMKPRPDLAGAQTALEHARAAGRDTTEVKALLAEVTIRLNGAFAGGADRLPPRAAATLRSALTALDPNSARASEKATVAMAKARIQLALGDADGAFQSAGFALNHLPEDAPIAASAEIRLVSALALYARDNKVEAVAVLADVLRDAPDAATASAASSYLVAAGDGAAARGLLSSAAESHDPKGAVHAVLATLLLAQGAPDAAASAIETARAASPDDAFFAEILGSVRVAQGQLAQGRAALDRFAEARAAYDHAIRLAPGLIEAHVRRALVALAEPATASSAEATKAACVQALHELEALRTRFGGDPLLLQGIGRMNLAVGDFAAARTALEAAAVMSPADADVWIALAEARRRSGTVGDGDALAGAAAAWGRARMVRPDDAAIALAEVGAWTDAGKSEVAVSACTEFLRRHAEAAAVLRARAACYLQLEMWSLAAADLRRLRELGAAGDADLRALVDALYRAGDQRAAAQAAEDAKGKVPAHVLEFLAALHGGNADAAIAHLSEGGPSLLLAEIQLAAGRETDSTETLRQLAKSLPGNPHVARLLVVELLGPSPVAAERIAEARALVASLAPGSPPGYARLIEGRILLAEENHAGAIAPLREAARALPDDPFAALFLGEALFRGGDRTESLVMLRKAAALSGASAPVKAIVANRLLQASDGGDLDRAESLAREAWRLDARCVGAAFRIMDLLHGRGDFAQAADVAELALRTSGPGPSDEAKLRLGAAFEHILAGEFQAAQVQLDTLPAQMRDGPSGRLLTGFAELGAGRIDAARRIFGALATADADNRIAAVGLLRCDLALGDRAAAAARVDAWCKAHPDDRDVSLAASRLFQRAGYADDSVRFAADCAARHPRDITAALNQATILRRAGRPAESVASLRLFAATGHAADPVAVCLAVATLCVQCATDLPDALVSAQTIAADPATTERARIEAAVIESEALVALRRLADGESAAQAALRRLDESPVNGWGERMLKARAHFVAGFAAASAVPPRRKQAMEEFVRCLDLDRENLDVANNLAWVMAEDGDAATAPRALELARKVTIAAPGDASYWDTRAVAAQRAGEPDEAEASWARALELLAASKPRDAARELRTALRCARFLRDDRKKPDSARQVAERIRPLVAGTSAEGEIDAFLASRQ